MKKLYSLFAAIVLAATVNAQTTATYTFSGANQSEVLFGTIDSNLTFVTAKGASAQSPTFYTAAPAAVRIYSDRATGDGNSFTISVATGYEITGLSFTAVASYNPTVTYSVDGGAFATMPKSTNDYTLSGIAAASTLTFKNAHLGGTSNIQLRIPSFTVTDVHIYFHLLLTKGRYICFGRKQCARLHNHRPTGAHSNRHRKGSALQRVYIGR